MGRRERLWAAVRREPVDRVPYAVWRHFPAVDGSPAGLAQATLRFHERYGSDLLKITPRAGYCVAAWGCVESAEARPEGFRPCAVHAVRQADDWAKIRALDPAAAEGWVDQLETIVRMGFDRRIGDAAVVPTLFSPLTIARKLAGERLTADLAAHPAAVAGALEAIAETVTRFAELALTEGVSGVFYAIPAADLALHTEEDYARFGEPHDRRVLQAVRARGGLAVIHAHGTRLMFERLATLPGDIWNWDDRTCGPSLAEGQARVPGAVMGGLDQRGTLHEGTAEQAVAECDDAVAQTRGVGLVLAPGCVLPVGTPDAPLAAVVRRLGGPLKPLPGVRLD